MSDERRPGLGDRLRQGRTGTFAEGEERERPTLPGGGAQADETAPPTEELQPGALADPPPVKTARYPGALPTGIPTGVERPWSEVIKHSADAIPGADEEGDEDPLESEEEPSQEETGTLSETEKTKRQTAGGRRRERRQERQESRQERRESRQEERTGISW